MSDSTTPSVVATAPPSSPPSSSAAAAPPTNDTSYQVLREAMLPSLIRTIPLASTEPSPEDIFTSSLGLIFTDDMRNQHGDDPSTALAYRSRKLGHELTFRVADPSGEEERRKFAHYLWNAGVLMAELVGGRPEKENLVEDGVSKEWWLNEEEDKNWNVEGESVLELGAGVGLAGIMSALAGAQEVVISDYPAPELLAAIRTNVEANIPAYTNVQVQGHQWGVLDTQFAKDYAGSFTRVLAADCLWMPHEHTNLARSMHHFLSPASEARVYVIAGFHTGRAKMAAFFEEAVVEEGLEVEEIFEMDGDGRRREWVPERDGGREDHAERKKWLVVARLKRCDAGHNDASKL